MMRSEDGPALGRVVQGMGLVPVFALLILTGCGDKGESGEPDEQEEAARAVCGSLEPLFDAVCAAMDRCEGAFFPIAYRSRRECRDILCFTTTCGLESNSDDDGFELVVRDLSLGEDQAAACIAWLEESDCSAFRGLDDGPCEGAIRFGDDDDDDDEETRSRVGESCEGRRCSNDGWCSPGSLDEEAAQMVCSLCEPLPSIGEPCTPFGTCVEGAWCEYHTEDGMRCMAPIPSGEPCSSDVQCTSGFCNRATERCDDGGNEGSPCSSNEECRYLLLCDENATCGARRANGEPCTEDTWCEHGTCHEDGRCGRPDGETCHRFQPEQCRSGRCDEDDRVCIPPLEDGQSCWNDLECASRICEQSFSSGYCRSGCHTDADCTGAERCNEHTRQCLDPQPDGGRCDEDAHCASGECNLASRCGPLPAPGDACSERDDCWPTGYCSGGQCASLKGPGEACDGFLQCAEPWLCLEGRCTLMNLTCSPARAGQLCAWLRVCDEASYCEMGSFRCRDRKRAGEDCTRAEECGPGTHCALVETGMQCVALGDVGATCSSQERCREDLWCDDGTCAERLGEGSPCPTAAACAPPLGCVDQDGSRVCGPSAAGQLCDWRTGCPDGYFCDDSWPERCRPQRSEGATCNDDHECEPELFCENYRSCAPRRGEGEECGSIEPCHPSLRCDRDTWSCQPPVPIGEPCRNHRGDCGSAAYCDYDSEAGDYVCKPRRELREPCDDNQECLSGVCDRTHGCLASSVCLMP